MPNDKRNWHEVKIEDLLHDMPEATLAAGAGRDGSFKQLRFRLGLNNTGVYGVFMVRLSGEIRGIYNTLEYAVEGYNAL